MNNNTQNGSALVYILIAVALLAALTATFMNSSSSQQVSTQKQVDVVAELKSQIGFIRSSILECTMAYPSGDNVIANSPATLPTLRPYNSPYPLKPNDTYLPSPTTGFSWIDDVRCPGNPGNSNQHVKIFGGTSGRYFPKPPKLFTKWYYYNGTSGVYVMTFTSATDSFIAKSLQKLEESYSKCEVDVIDATSGDVIVDQEGSTCNNGNRCLRVWLVAKPTAMYPNEAGCP